MTNALIVIDIQESFRRRPIWAETSNPGLVDNVNRLVDAWREAGRPVVWVLHHEPGTGGVFDPASGFCRYLDGLRAPAAGEPELAKTSHNAFTTTNLQQWLTERGVREITVTGIRSEQCVETTARVGSDLGFGVTYVVDATATFPIQHPDVPDDAPVEAIMGDPRTMPTADVVERTVRVLEGRFTTIRTVDDLVPVAVA